MARTKAKSGKGTTLATATTVGGTYTTVGELVSVGGVEITASTSEATHLTSDNSFEESIFTGWKTVSDIPFTINWEDDEYNRLQGLIGTELFFKITYPDTTTETIFGGLTSFGGGEIPSNATHRTSGKIKFLGQTQTLVPQAG
jgi:hypothetical protein